MDFIIKFGLVAVMLESCNGKLKLNFVAPEIGAGEEQCGFASNCLEKEALDLMAIDFGRLCSRAHLLARFERGLIIPIYGATQS